MSGGYLEGFPLCLCIKSSVVSRSNDSLLSLALEKCCCFHGYTEGMQVIGPHAQHVNGWR